MGINQNLLGEDFTPNPISLLEANRSLGYSIEEAISDLIDNSISAGATRISYELHWNNGNPFFILKDNGSGMSNENNEFINSFRLGAKNPLETRDPNDLGRFGFGMKTASLSQARILTVISKQNNKILSRSLDLNFISSLNGSWRLKKVLDNTILSELNFFNEKESGTIIRWDDWDRAPQKEEDFLSLNSQVNLYISVCFHRFIEKGISICNFDYPLDPCSPIPKGEGATLYSEIQLSKNKNAKLTSYILQHPKNWEEDYENSFKFNSFKLFEGFERQQGIYIYRCNRLLTPMGGWLGMLKNGNAAKLARVVIDYPNDADSLWSLDITKTNAKIPFEFKNEIQKLIDVTKKGSISKIVRGNRNINSTLNSDHGQVWKISENKEYNSFKYEVDIDHPFFKNLIENKVVTKKDLSTIINLISECLPVAKIIDNNDVDPSKHDRMLFNNELSEELLEIAKQIYQNNLSHNTSSVAFNALLNIEPFCYFESQLKKILL